MAIRTLGGITTLKTSRDVDRVGLSDKMLLYDTNLEFMFGVKIIAVTTDIAEDRDAHDNFLLKLDWSVAPTDCT